MSRRDNCTTNACGQNRVGQDYLKRSRVPTLIKTACGRDRVDVLPILLPMLCGSDYLPLSGFEHACRRGNVNVVRRYAGNHFLRVRNGFLLACQHPNPASLDIARHLLSPAVDGGTVGLGFAWACRTGNFDVAAWLVQSEFWWSMDPITQQKSTDLAFRWACKYGRFQVVQWLLRTFVSIDVHSLSAHAAVTAVRNGHVRVADLLRQAYMDRKLRLPPSLRWGGLRSVWIQATVRASLLASKALRKPQR